jgi:hypothetical protein
VGNEVAKMKTLFDFCYDPKVHGKLAVGESVIFYKNGTWEKITKELKQGRPKKRVPSELIKQLSLAGLGAKAISSRLKHQDYDVSYKTVQRILSRTPKSQSGQK